MSDAPIAFPDVERLVVDHLKNRTELTGVVVDNRPPGGFDGTQKAVLVSRTGGAWVDDRHLDEPLVDLEVYGPDKTTAHGVALAARAALLQARGTSYGTAYVTDVVEADGPRWLPDYNRPAGNRYLSTVRLLIRLA
ncbi:hypothetical protein [Streptomyces albireticuli]|uniref:DUF3168 domain-containing protein n=1 Tax=Streptomyces albireticuli TaxID=1940 RepID=A0A2A2D1Y4_9ACTN|nr:hypothetical protein [Streptomyces albireticuli]MCD9145171.1 hypothetical protein [Streptomyces albireticuli]MCD9164654.1 hypothetical protein [Streptomyces albireticuli]MCD9194919.1 hypothetical protein [Streptomyces albireticuli]PAU45409.1 hypothetical protein CK936_29475 [Streptomyces albireticuli]